MQDQKQFFIQSLFSFIADEQYVLLKWLGEDLMNLPDGTDLDILVTPSVENKIVQLIRKDGSIQMIDKAIRAGVKHYYLYFKDSTFLQIDLLIQLQRKNIVYLPTDYVFQNCRVINGIKTCKENIVLEHVLLFNYLNYSGLSNKYYQYFSLLPITKQASLIQSFNQKYNTSFANLVETTNFNPTRQAQMLLMLNQLKENTFFNKCKHGSNYLLGIWSALKVPKGKIITFSGVDGAGKSTILEDTKNLLQEKFRKEVVVLRHRPSILPILSAWRYGKKAAEEKSVARLPRQGNNNNTLASYFRFGYYYLDYLVGQLYVWVKYLLRGQVVLYDRYYFDFIVDGRRSNINLAQALPKSLYRFITKPDLNIFLYADVATILQRKQELEPSAITNLTQNYQQLFKEFSTTHKGIYLPIENKNRQTTLHTIEMQIVNDKFQNVNNKFQL